MHLPTGQDACHQLTQPFNTGMDFGRQSAPRTSKRLRPFFCGARRVLMRANDGAVQIDFLEIRILAQDRKDLVPDLLVRPAGETDIDAVSSGRLAALSVASLSPPKVKDINTAC